MISKMLPFCGLLVFNSLIAQSKPIPQGKPVSSQALANANNAFAANLYKELYKPNEAVFYAPYSITSAFSLLFAGTDGQSETDIAKTFGWDKNTTQHATAFAQLSKSLTKQKSAATGIFKPANRLFASKETTFSADYQKLVQNTYQAGIEPVDFLQPEATAQLINTWVGKQTEQKIKQIVPPKGLDKNTRLVLVNAVYFLAEWEAGFDPANTQKADFWADKKTPQKANFMQAHFPPDNLNQMKRKFGYKKTASYETFEMPYKGNAYSMLVVLPSEKSSLSALVNQLSPAKLAELDKDLAYDYEQVSLSLPKWTASYSLSLRASLEKMGLGSLFKKLDFSRALSGSGLGLSLSDVLHKSFIDVSEKGTEAAAVTAIMIESPNAPRELKRVDFKANRPFLYYIKDKDSGTILFMGQYVKP